MQSTKKKTRKWIWILLAVVVVIVVAFVVLSSATKRASQPVYSSYTVETGTIESTITGSGKLDSADSETIRVPGDIHVDAIPVEVGDYVKAGDVLATLDLASLEEQTAKISNELADLDAQISSRDKVERVEAPVRGRIKYLPTQEGDDVLSIIDEYGALAILSTDGKMQLEITTTQQLILHSEVTVKWDGGSADGTIAEKTQNGYLVTLTDKGTPYQATAQVYNDDQLLGEGILDIHAPVSVLAAGGEVTDVNVKENTLVYAGNILFSLESAPDSASYRTSFAERADKAALYELLLSYQNDPRILAKTDGYIDEVLLTENSDIASSSTTDGLTDAFTIHTGGAVKMSIDADELDIELVQLGQAATITLDAYPNEVFQASVTRISRIGTEDGSITTFPVEVTLSYDERLLEGMNGSAVIQTNRSENVVVLPVDLINEDAQGQYVMVMSATGELVRQDITTGLSDGTNAEITSGLSAGDKVWSLSDSSTSATGMFGLPSGKFSSSPERGAAGGGN